MSDGKPKNRVVVRRYHADKAAVLPSNELIQYAQRRAGIAKPCTTGVSSELKRRAMGKNVNRSELINVSASESRLWRRSIGVDPRSEAHSLDCAIVGFDCDSQALFVDYTREMQVRRERFVQLTSIPTLSAVSKQVNLLVLNLDSYVDPAVAVTDLLEFRSRSRASRVIITSCEFGRDEAGGHRKVICDVSLRWPVDSRRLNWAIEVALDQDDWVEI